ncbi:hypothetical protein PLICRDRAFT_117712 [Plicaturopsis crispa FD-325 SS-3]|uniref:NAD(P)-binding protein n=1 Tax=Plicaturopsis crispa FD-325 SS-3 TaxID=944288 RepID=A0A0C9T5C0_PLICR|nr:hypothetical protein PLICRDRAFT_117712 [Plicaturopsis crispa FD-325 SS-3]
MGAAYSLLFPGKPSYAGPGDLTGKVVLVTGGNAGIGYEMSKSLLANNATVYLAARTPSKAEKAIEQLKKETGKDAIHFIQLDLASLASVEAAAAAFKARESSLHILFNNAGLMDSKPGETTVDGYEVQMGTNVLGHHVFTMALLPVLLKTAKESESGTVRVVSTGSFAHNFASKDELRYDTLDTGKGLTNFRNVQLYSRSKLGNCIWTHAITKWYKSEGILAFTVHPGFINSEAFLNSDTGQYIFGTLFGHPTTSGAVNSLFVGTSPEITPDDAGSYYMPWMRKAEEAKAATDEKQWDQFWTWLEERRLKGVAGKTTETSAEAQDAPETAV